MTELNKLRDHSFDDIHEFDNYLPRWWLWSFYLACIFAVIYWLFYHGSNFGMLPAAHFEAEWGKKLELDAKSKPVSAAMLEEFAKQSKMVEAGKALFAEKCVTCHLADGSGQIGANLTDKYWIHGGSADKIYNTILKGGRPGKGMVAWESQIGKQKCQQLVAYIVSSIKNTNKPGKPPEKQ